MARSLSDNQGALPMLSKLNQNKWSLLALACIVGALTLSRGGVATLMPLVRVLLPVVVVLVAFNFL